MMEKHSELNLNIKSLYFAGFLIQEKTSTFMFIWFIFNIISYCILQVLAVVKYFMVPFSLIRTTVTVYLALSCSLTLFKHFYFYNKKKEIRELLELLQNGPEEDHMVKLVVEMKEKSLKRTQLFSYLVLGYAIFQYVAAIVIPLFYRVVQFALCSGEHTPECENTKAVYVYEFWWPTDVNAAPTYYFLITWQTLAVITYYSTLCTSDAFICSLMMAAAERASMLSRSLVEVFVVPPGGHTTASITTWAKYHQHYIRLVKRINDVMGPLLLVNYSCAAMNIIAYLYFYMKFNDDTVANMAMGALLGFMIQNYMYAYAGQKIINMSDDLRKSTLIAASQVTDGSYLSGPAGSSLQIIIARCSGIHSENFHGMGYFTIRLELFSKVLSASLTYLVVVLQICNCSGPIGYDH